MPEHSTHDARSQLSTWDILDLAPFRVYVIDVLTREVIYSNAARGQTGTRSDLKCHEQIYQEPRPCIGCVLPELVDAQGRSTGKVVTYERFDEAEDCWYQLHEGTTTLTDGRTAMYSIAIDIAAVKEAQNSLAAAHAELAFKNQQLESLSVTDRLTSLYNRRKLDEVLEKECERALRTHMPLSVIIADVDHFKSVNDLHGHQMGDRVLVDIARRLAHGVRVVDTVGRWGGEEFMILCPDTDLGGARALAESLRAAIERHEFEGLGHRTSSLGVAQYSVGEKPEDVVRRADEALLRAKSSGRNRVVAE